MKFQDKLRKHSKTELWDEYCGFLDLNITDFMYIQRRLMKEQIGVWMDSGLGRKLYRGRGDVDIDSFRATMPLTTYEDYADVLLARRGEMLPGEPSIWIQTTWEGGLRPIKVAPYTRGMLDTYRRNVVAVTMLAASRGRADFHIGKGNTVLYGGAPLPFATGLIPALIEQDISFRWLPDGHSGSAASFGERIREGFAMALRWDLDFFFAIGSVANYITESFSQGGGGGGGGIRPSIPIALRYARAKYLSKRDGKPLRPGDVFNLKGFVCTGNDANQYKKRLADAWGVTPIEIAAGTESTCIAAETWEQRGMVFFPDSCFYEFIPEEEMRKSLRDPEYRPRSCLMDEVSPGAVYELIISVFRGGAFMRYRIGDVYRCLSAGGEALPRFTYVDRTPNVIDIAGFTRITENTIEEVLRISGVSARNWIARKEYGENGHPFLHMYVELGGEALEHGAAKKQVLTDHLAAYFQYFDSDYSDLKKLLKMEPLNITILKRGTIERFEAYSGRALSRVNPSSLDISELLRFQDGGHAARLKEAWRVD